MIYIGRAAWGGPAAPFGSRMHAPAASVTVHHALSPSVVDGASLDTEREAMQQIHRHHRDVNRWQGIGYNFCITQSGNIYEGRGWGRVGAHAGTNAGNQTSIGICFLIDGRRESPTQAALDALAHLRSAGVKLGELARDHALKLHRDWKATECPGDMVVAALRSGRPPELPVLRRGDTGRAVAQLQLELVKHGHLTPAARATGPGIFGPATEAAVRSFQARERLTVDGIVGPLTWRALG